MEKFANTALIILCIIILWAATVVGISSIDEEHCKVNGAKYEMTTIFLQGYCRLDGVVIPAEDVALREKGVTHE